MNNKWTSEMLLGAIHFRINGEEWHQIYKRLVPKDPVRNKAIARGRVESPVYMVFTNQQNRGRRLLSFLSRMSRLPEYDPISREGAKFHKYEIELIKTWYRESKRHQNGIRELKPGDSKKIVKYKKKFKSPLPAKDIALILGRSTSEISDILQTSDFRQIELWTPSLGVADKKLKTTVPPRTDTETTCTHLLIEAITSKLKGLDLTALAKVYCQIQNENLVDS